MYKLESVVENEQHRIFRGFEIMTTESQPVDFT